MRNLGKDSAVSSSENDTRFRNGQGSRADQRTNKSSVLKEQKWFGAINIRAICGAESEVCNKAKFMLEKLALIWVICKPDLVLTPVNALKISTISRIPTNEIGIARYRIV